MEAAFEADELLKLLTEALRRGPGSPQWQQAVQRIADPALPGRDDYQLLITVRERLESGKPYREVRAGAPFTRKLFEKIDAGSVAPAPRRLSIAAIVAMVSLVILIAAAGVLISRMSAAAADDATLLQRQLFITPVRQWDFTTDLPGDVDHAGALPLAIRNGALRQKSGSDFAAIGALFGTVPVDVPPSICIEAQILVGPGRGGVGVFADAAAPAANGLNPSELAIWCGPGGVGVGFSTEPGSASRPIAPGPHTLRLKLSPTVAIAEVDGQQLWAGPHATGRSAIVGVRLAGAARGQESAVQSLRVLSP